MIYVLYGSNLFSLQQEIDNIKKSLGNPDLVSLNTCLIDGKNTTPDQIHDVCYTPPFLNPSRLVIVTGLLERFEPELRKKIDKTDSSGVSNSGKWKSMLDSLTGIPDSTIVILIDGVLAPSRNELLKHISTFARVKNFPELKGSNLTEWVNNKVISMSGRISPSAVKLLIEYMGNDLWTLNNEIEKLVSYCADEIISETDIEKISSYSKEISIFSLIDYILEKKTIEAHFFLERMIREGASSSYIVTMILRQIRLIIKAKFLETGLTKSQISVKLGLSSEYIADKTVRQSKMYSIEQLKLIYHNILDMDVDIKTGKFDNNMAMDLLVFNLCK